MRWIVDAVRTLVTAVSGVIATVAAVGIILLIVPFKRTSPLIDKVIRAWSRVWFAASRTTLHIEGQVNIDSDRSYVVVANHQSTLDIMACLLAVPLPIRFLAKKELFRIPILAQGMRAVGIIEVDRAARGAIHATVNRQAKELIDARRSLIIYAEGTRPRNGILQPFKKGAFTMAIAGQLPVLPLTLTGSYQAWPPGQPWAHGGAIHAFIDPAIETTGMTQTDTGDLRDRVFQIISQRVKVAGGEVA